ncbi:hypothetical protein D3C86_1860560 [compost metagenome]
MHQALAHAEIGEGAAQRNLFVAGEQEFQRLGDIQPRHFHQQVADMAAAHAQRHVAAAAAEHRRNRVAVAGQINVAADTTLGLLGQLGIGEQLAQLHAAHAGLQ